jgi:tetratricopeptide (TPR) repeat protein
MDRRLTGRKPTFSTKKNPFNLPRILILVALIAAGLWFASQVYNPIYNPGGQFEPLFLPTPTATRTVDSLVLEGEALFDAGKIFDPEGKDAIDAYYDVIERYPNNAQVRAELARLLTYSSALLSTAEDRTERLALARQEIMKAVELDPDDSTVQAIRALVLDWSSTSSAASQEERQDWLNEAEQAANLAITLDPNNSLALAFYAEVLLDQNQKIQAAESARLAVNQGPELMDTHRVYGTVLESLGEYRFAIEEFEKAVEINPNLTFLYIRIGVIYRALKVYDTALEYFAKAITVNQSNGVEDPLPYIAIAKTYSRDGEFFIAAVNGEKAIAINPTNADTYGQLGDIYVRARNYEGALPVLKCAVVGCTAAENEVGGVAVQALDLTNFDVAYYYARYASVLAALSRPEQNNCPEVLEIQVELRRVFGDDPTLMSIVAENEAICLLQEATPAP